MRYKTLLSVVILILISGSGLTASNEDFFEDSTGQGSVIINRYLQATQADAFSTAKNGPLEVEIEASVPKLNEHGHLTALRKISDVGKITYRVLGFQGDTTIKKKLFRVTFRPNNRGRTTRA